MYMINYNERVQKQKLFLKAAITAAIKHVIKSCQ